jgi:hypothetical protein
LLVLLTEGCALLPLEALRSGVKVYKEGRKAASFDGRFLAETL